MSTSDQPPHEARGALGQLIDPGGGIVPVLAPAPVPNAVAHARPGVTTGVIAPIAGPTVPSDDPGTLALLIARMAGELFGGASVVPPPGTSQPHNPAPAPSPLPQHLGLAGGAPASPGIATLPAPVPAGAPSEPSAFAVPPAGAAAPSTFGVPGIPPGSAATPPPFGGIPPSPFGG